MGDDHSAGLAQNPIANDLAGGRPCPAAVPQCSSPTRQQRVSVTVVLPMRQHVPSSSEGLVLSVKVKPRASRSRVLGMKEGFLEIAVAAPPVDGAANDELVGVLARTLNVPKSHVSIVGGTTSRMKRVLLRGVSESQLRASLP